MRSSLHWFVFLMSTTAKVELANTWSLELHLGLLPWGRQGPKHLSHCLLTLGCTVAGGRNGGGADTRSRHPKQWLTDSSPDACPLELMSFTRRDTQSSLSCTHLPTSPSPAPAREQVWVRRLGEHRPSRHRLGFPLTTLSRWCP